MKLLKNQAINKLLSILLKEPVTVHSFVLGNEPVNDFFEYELQLNDSRLVYLYFCKDKKDEFTKDFNNFNSLVHDNNSLSEDDIYDIFHSLDENTHTSISCTEFDTRCFYGLEVNRGYSICN
ncbi:hypothetical protein [Apilactobacillus timberlakei]|uniref:hypothetical protein n=1 Tax=Apilactobacillus timberlakei TaxID=2008380 RepID=UPI00112C66F3|nr:hypothetical protein [Apilactobacillus timberlakei]TPR16754.1 hypothetical protein DYZ95_07170 [Apilactobacillus timberlakei]TPR21517.1 hypothetical protein DY083_05720 [Apilactobacillus timberlakei]